MIRLEAVAKHYEGRPVLGPISLEIAAGTFCVLVGPSGSGKSTLLRLVNAMVPADAGRVLIGGRDIASVDAAELRRGIGYVIQSIGLFPHWSVRRNVATVPALLGWPRGRIEARVDELLALVGLAAPGIGGRRPHQLSGGQQQRVGVARALAADPPVLLMDEPFGALDPPTRRALQQELRVIQRATAKTVVFVTHDIDEAVRLGDRVLVLEAGAIVQDGPPEEIVRRPATALVRAFLGGGEATLALLARRTVQGAMRPGIACDGPAIASGSSLAAALGRMVETGADTLAVVDVADAPLGSLSFHDILRDLG